MKKILGLLSVFAVAALLNVAGAQGVSAAGFCYWKGSATDNKFSTATNWTGDNCVLDNNAIPVFGPTTNGTVKLVNDTAFSFGRVMYGFAYDSVAKAMTPVTSGTIKTTYEIDKLVLGDMAEGTPTVYKTMLDGKLLPDGTPSTLVQVNTLTFSKNAANTAPQLEIAGYGLLTAKPLTGSCQELDFAKVTMTDIPNNITLPASACAVGYKTSDTLTLTKSQFTYASTAKNVNVTTSSTLKGQGVMTGLLSVDSTSKVAPGLSPGCLSSTGLTLNGEYLFEVSGTTACTGYDQLVSSGPVTIGATAKLSTSVINNFVPAVGDVYRIIDNGTAQPIQGTFQGMGEGSTFTSGIATYKISYVGGTGNDVTLTVTAVTPPEKGAAIPEATTGATGEQGSAGAVGSTAQTPAVVPKVPNTGFELVRANPVMTALVTTGATVVLGLLARRLHS